MTFTVENITSQITQLLLEYPDLEVIRSDPRMVCLHGDILVFRTYNDFTLRKTYIWMSISLSDLMSFLLL
jgi:hypothetical protein